MDIAVNKPAKDFVRQKFQSWYGEQIAVQLEGTEDQVIETVDLSMIVMKEAGSEWLESMFKYINDNPQFIVNGFVRAGITGTLDGKEPDNESVPDIHVEESTSEDSKTDEDDEEEDNTTFCSKATGTHEYYMIGTAQLQ